MGTKGLDDHPPRWESSSSFSCVFCRFCFKFFSNFSFQRNACFSDLEKKKTLRRYIKYTHCFALLLLLLLFGRGGGISNVIIK